MPAAPAPPAPLALPCALTVMLPVCVAEAVVAREAVDAALGLAPATSLGEARGVAVEKFPAPGLGVRLLLGVAVPVPLVQAEGEAVPEGVMEEPPEGVEAALGVSATVALALALALPPPAAATPPAAVPVTVPEVDCVGEPVAGALALPPRWPAPTPAPALAVRLRLPVAVPQALPGRGLGVPVGDTVALLGAVPLGAAGVELCEALTPVLVEGVL